MKQINNYNSASAVQLRPTKKPLIFEHTYAFESIDFTEIQSFHQSSEKETEFNFSNNKQEYGSPKILNDSSEFQYSCTKRNQNINSNQKLRTNITPARQTNKINQVSQTSYFEMLNKSIQVNLELSKKNQKKQNNNLQQSCLSDDLFMNSHHYEQCKKQIFNFVDNENSKQTDRDGQIKKTNFLDSSASSEIIEYPKQQKIERKEYVQRYPEPQHEIKKIDFHSIPIETLKEKDQEKDKEKEQEKVKEKEKENNWNLEIKKKNNKSQLKERNKQQQVSPSVSDNGNSKYPSFVNRVALKLKQQENLKDKEQDQSDRKLNRDQFVVKVTHQQKKNTVFQSFQQINVTPSKSPCKTRSRINTETTPIKTRPVREKSQSGHENKSPQFQSISQIGIKNNLIKVKSQKNQQIKTNIMQYMSIQKDDRRNHSKQNMETQQKHTITTTTKKALPNKQQQLPQYIKLDFSQPKFQKKNEEPLIKIELTLEDLLKNYNIDQ